MPPEVPRLRYRFWRGPVSARGTFPHAGPREPHFASERDLGRVRVRELTPAMTTAKQVRRRLPLLLERRQMLVHLFGGPSVGAVFLPERFDGVGVRLQLVPSDAPEERRGVAAVV